MGRLAFLMAAGISLFGAMIHFAVLASAQAGGFIAPTGALLIGALMVVCALYALAGAGLLRWLPFAQMVQGTVAAVCLLRGLLVLPYLYKFPGHLWTCDALASAVWLSAGLGFLVGILQSAREQRVVIAASGEVPGV